MLITKSMLLELNACGGALDKYFATVDSYDAKELLNLALKNEDYSYAQWCMSRLMTPLQRVAWSIYCAAQVIKIYEKEYPDDQRPRNAIKAAKKYLKCPTAENAASAAWRASWSAESASRSAESASRSAESAASAARSAAWSAESAANATWSAAWSAESASRSAAWSAESAESAARSAAWSAESAESAANAESAASAAWSAAIAESASRSAAIAESASRSAANAASAEYKKMNAKLLRRGFLILTTAGIE